MICVFAERRERRKISLKEKLEYFLRGLGGIPSDISDKNLIKMLDVVPKDLIPQEETERWVACNRKAVGKCQVCGRSACKRHLRKYVKHIVPDKEITYSLCVTCFGKLLILNRVGPNMMAALGGRLALPTHITKLGIVYTVGECPNCGTALVQVEIGRMYGFWVEGEEKCLRCNKSLGIHLYPKKIKQQENSNL